MLACSALLACGDGGTDPEPAEARVRLAGTGGRGGPVRSPDGSEIAFAGYGDSIGTPYVSIVPSAGGTPVVLAGSPANAHPTSWK
jgi:hypothetical protein